MILDGIEHDNITIADDTGFVLAVIADGGCVERSGYHIVQNATYTHKGGDMYVATSAISTEQGDITLDINAINNMRRMDD